MAEPGFPLGFPEPTAHAVVSVKVELGLAAGGGGLSPKWLDQSQNPAPPAEYGANWSSYRLAPGTGLHVTNGSPVVGAVPRSTPW